MPGEILNIAAYRFVDIDDVDGLANAIRAQCESRDLRGTVLVAPEGLNVFLAGKAQDVESFLAWLGADARFAGLDVKRSRSAQVPFARLKVKRKREIIAFSGRKAAVGNERTSSVLPRTLARWLQTGSDDQGRRVVLLDTRNRQEIAHGTFEHAVTLPIDRFNALPAAVDHVRETLHDATVVSFCTGGVRCEKAAPWLAQSGIANVMQLEGGILRYFDEVGGAHYRGGCFVFDERIALDPGLRPLRDLPVATVP